MELLRVLLVGPRVRTTIDDRAREKLETGNATFSCLFSGEGEQLEHAVAECDDDLGSSDARGWGRVRTFAAAWKLFTVFPRLLPSSGSLLGPKSTAATPPMTTSSGRPRPNRPIVATDLLPAPRAPPAETMPALSAEGLPRNAGADPVRPDMAHDLGACALGAEVLPRASPGRTTVAVAEREAMTILF